MLVDDGARTSASGRIKRPRRQLVAGLALMILVGGVGGTVVALSASADPPVHSKASPPPDRTAPATPSQVDRPGSSERSGQKSIKVKSGSFTDALTWADGVSVEVTSIEQGETTGTGPGTIVGLPLTTFSLKLTNASEPAINATNVVITTSYGKKPGQLASGVYDERSADFSTTVEPGDSATAVYSFSVPPTELDQVELTVDLDDLHAPATFAGAAR